MSRAEVDEAIRRHGDFETLYDKPYEDKKTVRVTGPFAAESLSPHRSLGYAGGPGATPPRPEQSSATLRSYGKRTGGGGQSPVTDSSSTARTTPALPSSG